MKRKSINSMMLGLAAISVLLFSHGIVSYAQNYSPNATLSANTSSATSNSTLANNATSQSDNPTVQSIDAAIKALNDGDKDTAKKLLLKAEESLEGKSDLVDAEKRVEASLAALKDGDINGAISHAEEAKKNLS
jgi:hypothetical protein